MEVNDVSVLRHGKKLITAKEMSGRKSAEKEMHGKRPAV